MENHVYIFWMKNWPKRHIEIPSGYPSIRYEGNRLRLGLQVAENASLRSCFKLQLVLVSSCGQGEWELAVPCRMELKSEEIGRSTPMPRNAT